MPHLYGVCAPLRYSMPHEMEHTGNNFQQDRVGYRVKVLFFVIKKFAISISRNIVRDQHANANNQLSRMYG